MIDETFFQDELNRLADKKAVGRVEGAGTTAMILRYEPLLLNSPKFFAENPSKCYVFEIGKNYGTVFSAKCVREIRAVNGEYIIYLKGR